jgi:hypothetical protein
MSVDDFLSKDEKVVDEIGDLYLTKDRVIKYTENGKNKDYTDIQLSELSSFIHETRFNYYAAILGGLISLASFMFLYAGGIPAEITDILKGTMIFGLLMILYAYLTISKEYIIKASSGVTISSTNPKTQRLWKAANQKMNH